MATHPMPLVLWLWGLLSSSLPSWAGVVVGSGHAFCLGWDAVCRVCALCVMGVGKGKRLN